MFAELSSQYWLTSRASRGHPWALALADWPAAAPLAQSPVGAGVSADWPAAAPVARSPVGAVVGWLTSRRPSRAVTRGRWIWLTDQPRPVSRSHLWALVSVLTDQPRPLSHGHLWALVSVLTDLPQPLSRGHPWALVSVLTRQPRPLSRCPGDRRENWKPFPRRAVIFRWGFNLVVWMFFITLSHSSEIFRSLSFTLIISSNLCYLDDKISTICHICDKIIFDATFYDEKRWK